MSILKKIFKNMIHFFVLGHFKLTLKKCPKMINYDHDKL